MAQPKLILDGLPIGVWVGRAPDGTVAYTNPAFAEILGQPAVPGADIDAAPAAYGICDRAGRPYPVERLPFSRVLASGKPEIVDDLVIHRADGARVHVRAFASPLHDATGATTHVAVSFIDVSREVLVERERDDVGARLAFAVHSAPIVIWTADDRGIVTLSEGAGLRGLGVRSGELVGKSLFDLYGDHPTICANIRRGLAGETFSYATELPGVTYETCIAPLRDHDGRIVGVAGLSQDVTELRQLQATAIRDDRIRALGTLAASVAHEINNPLTYVMAHLERIDRRLADLESRTNAGEPMPPELVATAVAELRDSFAPVVNGTDRIARITRELRTFSRPDDETVGAVDLSAVVTSVLELVRKEVEAAAVLVCDLAPVPHVLANEGRLVQVVLNLVLNALHAVRISMSAERRVEISTRAEPGRALIEISDSGPGIPAEMEGRLFEPFATSKGIGEGTGLGLFVSRNIVRAAGGDIEAGRCPEGGARFTVWLPRAATAPGESVRPPARELRKKPGPRVLIIDDEPLVAASLAGQLRAAGYDAVVATSGDAGLALLAEDAMIELVFCDLMMTGTTGMDVAAEVERTAPERARSIVYMTGGAFTARGREFLERRPTQTVLKPFDVVSEAARRLDGAT